MIANVCKNIDNSAEKSILDYAGAMNRAPTIAIEDSNDWSFSHFSPLQGVNWAKTLRFSSF